jgi:hypothetical protein
VVPAGLELGTGICCYCRNNLHNYGWVLVVMGPLVEAATGVKGDKGNDSVF